MLDNETKITKGRHQRNVHLSPYYITRNFGIITYRLITVIKNANIMTINLDTARTTLSILVDF